jgi:hypothetical protein
MWSTTPPTEPGYYWLRWHTVWAGEPKKVTQFVSVTESEGMLFACPHGAPGRLLSMSQGEWQPVAPPIEQVILPSNGTRDYICGQIAEGVKNSGLPREQVEIVLRNLYAAFDLFWPMAD